MFNNRRRANCFILILAIAMPLLIIGLLLGFADRQFDKMSNQRNTIEGVVDNVETYEKEIVTEYQDHEGNTKKKTRNVTVTKVTFADGRFKEFSDVPPAPLEVGVEYVILYDGFLKIIEIKEKVDYEAEMENLKESIEGIQEDE